MFQVDTLGVTAALFRQHTSRTVDPQLHTHAIICAKVQDTTGRWLSLDARFLKYQQRSIGWIYDAALRTELTSRLGVDWTEAANGTRDPTCVPEELNVEFSSRTEQVDAKLAELIRRWSDENNGADPDPRTIAGLQRKAVIASRPSKSHGAAGEILHMGWSEQAYAIGFDPDQLTADRLAVERATTGGQRVVAYFALAATGVANDSGAVPGAVRRQAPKEVPCLILARLAVDQSFQGKSLGRRLFQDGLWRSARVAKDVGFRALLVHARDERAAEFYKALTPSFRSSPSDALHLFLPLKAIGRLAETSCE